MCIVYLHTLKQPKRPSVPAVYHDNATPLKKPNSLSFPTVYHDNVTHDKITHTLQKLVKASRYERNNKIKSRIERVIRKY